MLRMPPCEVGAGRVGGAVAVAELGRPLATLETRAAAAEEEVCMMATSASARAREAEKWSSDRLRTCRMVKQRRRRRAGAVRKIRVLYSCDDDVNCRGGWIWVVVH